MIALNRADGMRAYDWWVEHNTSEGTTVYVADNSAPTTASHTAAYHTVEEAWGISDVLRRVVVEFEEKEADEPPPRPRRPSRTLGNGLRHLNQARLRKEQVPSVKPDFAYLQSWRKFSNNPKSYARKGRRRSTSLSRVGNAN